MSSNGNPLGRKSEIKWIPVSEIMVSPHSQRKHRDHKSEKIASNFDPDKMGIPVVSYRDGRYWVIDGQHRIGALKIMGYSDQLVECQVYEGLTERQEAEMFDGLNDSLRVSTLDKFLVRLTAQRERECEIARVVSEQDMAIGQGGDRIGAVAALEKVYDRAGPDRLGMALRIIRDSFGPGAMKSEMIQGMGLVAHRYNGRISEANAVERLQRLRGGYGELVTKAEVVRRQTGRTKAESMAAAIVDAMNAGRGGKKIPDWWSPAD